MSSAHSRELRDRLQPALLDRLTDDEPDRREESRAERVLDLDTYRTAVLRDLSWLLNAASLDCALTARDGQSLEELPEVASSVINFGIPDFSGRTLSGLQLKRAEEQVETAIRRFEPRLIGSTLKVKAKVLTQIRNAVVFEISGELWAQPLKERLHLRTELDLETGQVSVESVEKA